MKRVSVTVVVVFAIAMVGIVARARNPIRPDFWQWSYAKWTLDRGPLPNVPGVPTQPFGLPKISVQFIECSVPTSVIVHSARQYGAVELGRFADGQKVPQYLAGAKVLKPIDRPSPDRPSAKIELQVTEDGPVFLAAPFRKLKRADHDAGALSQRALRRNGWTIVSHLVAPQDLGLARVGMGLYLRQCKGGEELSLQVDALHPPLVIIPQSRDMVPDLAKIDPEEYLPEFVQRRAIAAKVESLLRQHRFDAVEAMSQSYLDSSAKFPSGASKFSAVGTAFVYDGDDPTAEEIEEAVGLTEAWLKTLPKSNAAKLAVATTLSESLEWNLDGHGIDSAAADEVRRRALELVYDVEASGCTAPDLYQAALRIGYLADWEEDLVDRYFDKALESGAWCPEALAMAYLNYSRIYKVKDEYDRWQRLKTFFQQLTEGTKEKFGDAMLAAVVSQISFKPLDSGLHSAGIDWANLKESFESLRRRFPASQYNLQQFCRWACCAGDRETASALFGELGEFPFDELEGIWIDELEVRFRRHWASPEFAIGRQDVLFDHPARDLAFPRWHNGEEEILFCDADGVAWIMKTATGQRLRWGRATAGPVTVRQGVFYYAHGQNQLTYGGYSGSFARLRIKERDRRLYKVTDREVTATTMHPSEKWGLAAHDDGLLRIYDLGSAGYETPRTFNIGGGKEIHYLAFLEESRFLCVTEDGKARILNFPECEQLKSWQGMPTRAIYAVLSPDRTRLAMSGGPLIRIWSIADERLLSEVSTGAALPRSLAFSADGRLLAWGLTMSRVSPSPIGVLDYEKRALIAKFEGHQGSVVSLDFSADGTKLLSAGLDQSLRIWSLPQR